MNKRFILLGIAAILLCFAQIFVIAADNNIKVIVNGRELSLSQPPTVHNGHIMLPLRAVLEEIGIAVFYEDGYTNCVTRDKTVTLIESTVYGAIISPKYFIFIDNTEVAMAEEPMVLNNKLMIPAGFITAFGGTLGWEKNDLALTITTNIPKEELLSPEEIAACDAFTAQVARELLANNPIYKYFNKTHHIVMNGPAFNKGIKSQCFTYEKNANEYKVVSISQTEEVIYRESNKIYDSYHEYPEYKLAPHAKYLPFQERYDGYLGAVVYENVTLMRMSSFYKEYFSATSEDLLQPDGFDSVTIHPGTEHFLIFSKYEGTTVSISTSDSEGNEEIIYSGGSPVILYASASKSASPKFTVKFTLGKDFVLFSPEDMTGVGIRFGEATPDGDSKNVASELKRPLGNGRHIPHNRIMNLTNDWSIYGRYEYFY